MPKIHAVAAVILALVCATPANAGERARREAQIDEIRHHLVARDFAWLDQSEHSLRLHRSRTATGVWKLELFYNALWYLAEQGRTPDCADNAEPLLAEWRAKSPKSPAPFIVSAYRLLEIGWCLRGDGFADSVTEEAWEPFHEHVNAAYQMLERHKEVASKDPHYYAVMAAIYIAQGRRPQSFAALVAEAVKREPYYYRFYQEAFRYYEPQWNGSFAQEQEFASLAVNKTRAKDRTSAFARIYLNALGCGCMPPATAVDLRLLRQSMQDLVTVYPDPWNVSHMARMACAIGDGALARHYFDALPADDNGQSGWADVQDGAVQQWQTCRDAAGLTAKA